MTPDPLTPSTDSPTPITDDAFDAYDREACGTSYIRHKMQQLERENAVLVKEREELSKLTDEQRADIAAHVRGLLPGSSTYPAPLNGWTCFHCGETFTTYDGALLHFGENPKEQVDKLRATLDERDREIESLKQSKEIILDRLDDAIAVGIDRDEKSELVSEVLKESGKVFANECDSLRAQLAETQAMIEKSNLIEVPSCQVASDSCGAPVLRSSGTILRHKDYMAEVEQKTKLLQQLAAKARELHAMQEASTQLIALQAHVEECHAALREVKNWLLHEPSELLSQVDAVLSSQPDLPLIEEVRVYLEDSKTYANTFTLRQRADQLLARLNPAK